MNSLLYKPLRLIFIIEFLEFFDVDDESRNSEKALNFFEGISIF
jgi:hypothetical protein